MSCSQSSNPPVDVILDCQDTVGESVVWDERGGALLWVDIIGKRIHRFNLAQSTHDVWDTPDFVTGIGLREDGGAIVGLMKEVCLWDFGDSWQSLAAIEKDRPDNRLNECGVAPDGAFWVGTMQNNFDAAGAPIEFSEKTGAYYRIQADGKVKRLTDNRFGITNTMAWTEDGRFLTADTMANQIYAFPFDRDQQALGVPVPFAKPLDRGLPDGSCLDSEGFLWNCRVAGGACLARYTPNGQLDRIVELPCSWPTSCSFGGPDLRSLFITSAKFTMSERHLQTHPHEGNLYRVDVGVAGLPCHRFQRIPKPT